MRILLVFSNFEVEIKNKSQKNPIYNFCAKFRQIVDICKSHSGNLVNSLGNVSRIGVVPRFSDLEVIALSLTAEALGIDSENYLFHMLSKHMDDLPNLISRRQYNDRRKLTAGLCEEIRKGIADSIDGGYRDDELKEMVRKTLGCQLEVVLRPEQSPKKFSVIPLR